MSGNSDIDALLSLINTAAIAAVAEYRKYGQEVPPLTSTAQHPLDVDQNTIALKKAIRLLEGACDQLCTSLAPPSHTLMDRVNTFDTACLHVAVQAKIPDVLAPYPDGLPVDKLAEIVQMDRKKLARVLRQLATKNCFCEVDVDVFANNRLSVLLCSFAGNGMYENTKLYGYEIQQGGHILPDHLMDPELAYSYDGSKSPFMYSVKGEGIDGVFFDWMEKHPDRRENFGSAMIAVADVLGCLNVIHAFPWQDVTTVCDVGAGIGAFSMSLAKKYSHVKITLQDRPETLGQAHNIWANEFPEAVSEHRVNFVPFNFLADAPVQGQDIYYMRFIVHNWPDAEAVKILRNVRQAMAPHSRILVQDYVIRHVDRKSGQREMSSYGVELAPQPMLPNFGSGMVRMYNQDISMLILYHAKERTLHEMQVLGASAGLQLTKVWDLAETFCLEFKVAE